MGHKIHPTGLRLGITQEHRSRWYASSKSYPALLQEDDRIRKFIHKKYGSAGISDVLIARKADQLEVELKTARPGVLVGRQGSGIEDLRSGIQKTVKNVLFLQVCIEFWGSKLKVLGFKVCFIIHCFAHLL